MHPQPNGYTKMKAIKEQTEKELNTMTLIANSRSNRINNLNKLIHSQRIVTWVLIMAVIVLSIV